MTEWIVTSSAMILIIIALRGLLKGKISLRLQYALWALVLARLLLPFSIVESAISVSNLLTAREANAAVEEYKESYEAVWQQYAQLGEELPEQEMEQQVQQELYDRTYERIEREYAQTGQTVLPQRIETEAKRQVDAISLTATVMELLPYLWVGGMVLVAAVLAVSNLHFAWKLRKNRTPMDIPGVPLRVYRTDFVATPCLFGIGKPGIYLTGEITEDSQMREHVITHELSHYRQKDHIWSALRCVCLVLHWYNPFVWVAAVLSKRDAELACDERTIRTLGEDQRTEYGKTLISMTCVHRDPKSLMLTATTMMGTKKALKERVRLIAKKPKAALYTLIACVVVAVIAVGCTFTGAPGEEATEPLNFGELSGEELLELAREEALLEQAREALEYIQNLEHYEILERNDYRSDGKETVLLPWGSARYLHTGDNWYHCLDNLTHFLQKDGHLYRKSASGIAEEENPYLDWTEVDPSEQHLAAHSWIMDLRWDGSLARELRSGERLDYKILSVTTQAERNRDAIVLELEPLGEGETEYMAITFWFDRQTGTPVKVDQVVHTVGTVATIETTISAAKAEDVAAIIDIYWQEAQRAGEQQSTQPAEPDPGPEDLPTPQLPQLSPSDPLEGEPLTREELDWFQNVFFTYTNTDAQGNPTFNIRNMFLRAEFETPEEINLRTVFYDGVSRFSEVSQEEKDLYDKVTNDDSLLDYAKTPREDMERLFYENTGITIDQSQKIGLENLIYLEEYDAYYVKKGDTGYAYWNMAKGAWMEDGTVVILYTPKGETPVYVSMVTLAPRGDSYVFVSNVRGSK